MHDRPSLHIEKNDNVDTLSGKLASRKDRPVTEREFIGFGATIVHKLKLQAEKAAVCVGIFTSLGYKYAGT